MVSELDEAWALALAEAEQRARVAGRHDLAEYLALRNSNDLLRKTGIDWCSQRLLTWQTSKPHWLGDSDGKH